VTKNPNRDPPREIVRGERFQRGVIALIAIAGGGPIIEGGLSAGGRGALGVTEEGGAERGNRLGLPSRTPSEEANPAQNDR